jgi:phosphopantetheine adenylyltransferase
MKIINGQRKIKGTTLFIIDTENIKYIGQTLIKQVKDLHGKNCKSLKKEVGEEIRRSKDPQCSCNRRINIVKIAT